MGRAEQRLGAQAAVAASLCGLCGRCLLAAREVSALGSASPSGKWDDKAPLGEWLWPIGSTQYTHWKAPALQLSYPPSQLPLFLLLLPARRLGKGLQANLKTLFMHLLTAGPFLSHSQLPVP